MTRKELLLMEKELNAQNQETFSEIIICLELSNKLSKDMINENGYHIIKQMLEDQKAGIPFNNEKNFNVQKYCQAIINNSKHKSAIVKGLEHVQLFVFITLVFAVLNWALNDYSSTFDFTIVDLFAYLMGVVLIFWTNTYLDKIIYNRKSKMLALWLFVMYITMYVLLINLDFTAIGSINVYMVFKVFIFTQAFLILAIWFFKNLGASKAQKQI